MSDEEKRIFDEKNRLEKIKGNDIVKEQPKEEKIAEITEVKFLDKDGKEKNVFETGEDMSVRVAFKINNMKDLFNFSLSLYNQEGDYLIGINTILDKINTRNYVKDGCFEVLFKKIPFNSNTYYAKVYIVKDNFNLPYDFLLKTHTFGIISKNKFEGIGVDYKWI